MKQNPIQSRVAAHYAKEIADLKKTIQESQEEMKRLSTEYLKRWRRFDEGQKVKVVYEKFDLGKEKKIEEVVCFVRNLTVLENGEIHCDFFRPRRDGKESREKMMGIYFFTVQNIEVIQ